MRPPGSVLAASLFSFVKASVGIFFVDSFNLPINDVCLFQEHTEEVLAGGWCDDIWRNNFGGAWSLPIFCQYFNAAQYWYLFANFYRNIQRSLLLLRVKRIRVSEPKGRRRLWSTEHICCRSQGWAKVRSKVSKSEQKRELKRRKNPELKNISEINGPKIWWSQVL